ncbi:dicarboxylate/amino acid:cation symporter [Lysinibacter cavernae]|uniref:Na+/H+-dicarboxylate symporter n=1 Tax=Lysinibacter cavernae TaxID=1640652 RepID=A0A7X5R065_9MICO|nr:dicarboxylate/amino acid:cation symporter [Lysinibacter cavernae]NIH53143.1 Na+/H+-dicarboxylate symporter [Lysinibacter cavernae]
MTSSSSAAPTAAQKTRKLPRWATSFGPQITIALVLGVIVGLIAREMGMDGEGPNWLTGTLSTIGGAYVSLLQVMVAPLVFTAVVSSISNLSKVSNAARLATQTIIWFAITALIAVAIGIAIGIIAQPGGSASVEMSDAAAPSKTGSWWAFFTSLVPQNILGLGASTMVTETDGILAGTTSLRVNVLQLLVIAIAIGIAALKVGEKAQPFLRLNESALAVVQKVLWWVIRLAPIGTLALIGNAVASYGWEALGKLGVFSISIYVGLAIVMFVVYPLLARVHGLSIGRFFSGVWPAVQLGFVSRSSLGTLPLTQRVTERNLGVPREYASFAVPLGATTKMDGCAAIYPAIAAIFIAQFYGIDLTISQYLLIALVSVLGSTATAGTTGATVMLTLTLSTVGLPLEGVGLLLAVEPIIDMGRTALNVAGQALVPTIVAKREGILNEELYNAPRNGNPFADEDLIHEADPTEHEPAAR